GARARGRSARAQAGRVRAWRRRRTRAPAARTRRGGEGSRPSRRAHRRRTAPSEPRRRCGSRGSRSTRVPGARRGRALPGGTRRRSRGTAPDRDASPFRTADTAAHPSHSWRGECSSARTTRSRTRRALPEERRAPASIVVRAGYVLVVNRALDVAIAGAGLVVTSPLLAVGALAVKVEDGGPVLYRQTRVGKDGIDFELLKLRTMVVGAEHKGAGFAVDRGDARITRVGRVLRRLSLDELPQLWNVVRGDMSVIGPRPTLRYQVERYDERQLH